MLSGWPIILLLDAVRYRRRMEGSSRAATAADVGRGAPCSALPKDYRVILPPLPTGEGQRRAVVLHCDVTGSPYRIDDFRKPLKDAGIIQQVGGIGAYQMSHVWLLNLKTDEAKQALLDAGPLLVKNRPCLIIDPARQELRIKLHWVAFDVTSETIRRAFREYGEVKEVISDRWKAEDFEGAESTTRLVRLFLREGVTPDRVAHQMRLGSGTALVVVPGRAPLCLRCHNTGHIRRECRVPRCAACRAFGHEQANCTRSYARVASAGGDVDRSEMLMDEEEAESVAAVAASTSDAATAVASTRDAVSQENKAADARAGDATLAGASTVQHEEEEVCQNALRKQTFQSSSRQQACLGLRGKQMHSELQQAKPSRRWETMTPRTKLQWTPRQHLRSVDSTKQARHHKTRGCEQWRGLRTCPKPRSLVWPANSGRRRLHAAAAAASRRSRHRLDCGILYGKVYGGNAVGSVWYHSPIWSPWRGR